jgi:hypothetical protein
MSPPPLKTPTCAYATAALLAALAGAVPAPAHAAEIVLKQSAVEKLVVKGMFTRNGRFEVQPGPCSVYFDSPTVSIPANRVSIRSRLSARLGLVVGNNCQGVALASWTTVSGRPVADGGKVRLVDIRIDEIDDGPTRALAQLGLMDLPNAVELDVLSAVRTMLQGVGSQVQSEVESFDIGSVAAANGELSIKFEFKLIGR